MKASLMFCILMMTGLNHTCGLACAVPVIYEEVIACNGYDSATIVKEIQEYLQEQQAYQLKIDSCSMISGTGVLKIYNRLIGSIKNPAGEITFNFNIDVKDQKFRYKMHNIWFTAYERDRYGRFWQSQDHPVSVDPEVFRYGTSLLKKIERQTHDHINDVIAAIKKKIKEDKLNPTDW